MFRRGEGNIKRIKIKLVILAVVVVIAVIIKYFI